MKLFLLTVLTALGFGAWYYAHREPPSITVAAAKAIADNALLDFCSSEKAGCYDFAFKGTKEPTDRRFVWAFHFLDAHGDPWKQVVVSVGKTGAFSVEYTMPPPVPDAAGAPAAAAQAAAAPAPGEPPPAIPSEAPPLR